MIIFAGVLKGNLVHTVIWHSLIVTQRCAATLESVDLVIRVNTFVIVTWIIMGINVNITVLKIAVSVSVIVTVNVWMASAIVMTLFLELSAIWVRKTVRHNFVTIMVHVNQLDHAFAGVNILALIAISLSHSANSSVVTMQASVMLIRHASAISKIWILIALGVKVVLRWLMINVYKIHVCSMMLFALILDYAKMVFVFVSPVSSALFVNSRP